MLRRTIGQRVRALRERAGLSQLQLARRARVSTNALSKIERGAGGRVETIERVAVALGTSLSALASGASPKVPAPALPREVTAVAQLMTELPAGDVRAVEALVRGLVRARRR